jgi:hypothetical protein
MRPYDQTLQRSSELALAASCKRVGDAKDPASALQHETKRIGRLVYGGLLDFYAAWCELLIAAVMGGLEQRDIVPIISKGFDYGKRNPITRPIQLVEVSV